MENELKPKRETTITVSGAQAIPVARYIKGVFERQTVPMEVELIGDKGPEKYGMRVDLPIKIVIIEPRDFPDLKERAEKALSEQKKKDS